MSRRQRKANLKKMIANNDPAVQSIPQLQEKNRRLLRSTKTAGSNILIKDNESAQEGQSCKANIDHRVETSTAHGNSSAHAQSPKRRMNLTRFIFKSKSDIPPQIMQTEQDSDDFETPVKKIKRAPKLSQPTVMANSASTSNVRKKKRQQKITTAFLRNEQMFAEVVAQHSAAENFNPDEVQLALALSRSEAETKTSSECSAQVDKIHESKESRAPEEEDIRSKLKKFGFRTANKEDYTECFATVFLNGQRRKKTKTKWGNKFTALTLRDPNVQSKKLCSYVEKISNQNLETRSLSELETKFEPYQLQSSMLSQYAIVDESAQILRNMQNLSTTEQLERFYIEELFPVTKVPAGHLLKDWTIIPGRDLSPDREHKRISAQARKYKKFYEELESYFSNGLKDPPFVGEEIVPNVDEKTEIENSSSTELDGLLDLIANSQKENLENMDFEIERPSEHSSTSIDDLRKIEADDLRKSQADRTSPREENDNKKKLCLSPKQSSACEEHVDLILTSSTETSQNIRTQEQLTSQDLDIENTIHSSKGKDSSADRLELALALSTQICGNSKAIVAPTSPDLFADSDSDDAGVVEENKSNNITTYEVYSSDDVKTSSEAGCKTDLLSVKADAIVDLTQDDEILSDDLSISHSKKLDVSKRLDFIDFTNGMAISQRNVTPLPFEESEEIQDEKSLEESFSKSLTKSLPVLDTVQLQRMYSFDVSMKKGDRSEINESMSLRNNSVPGIDLTQSDHESTFSENGDNNEEDDVCILLSDDDEVNYSIMKANDRFSKSFLSSDENSGDSFCEKQLKQLEKCLQIAKGSSAALSDSKRLLFDTKNSEDSFCEEKLKQLDESLKAKVHRASVSFTGLLLSSAENSNDSLGEDQLSQFVESLKEVKEHSTSETCPKPFFPNAEKYKISSCDENLSQFEGSIKLKRLSASLGCSKSSIFGAKKSNDRIFNEEFNHLENSLQKLEQHNFSVLDLIDVEHSFQLNEQSHELLPKSVSFNLSGDEEPINKEYLTTDDHAMDYPTTPIKPLPINNLLKQQRAEFGILESQSEGFSQTPPHWMKSPGKVTPIKISSPPLSSSKEPQPPHRRSSHSRKFQSFIFEVPKSPVDNIADTQCFEYDDFDEFDRLVYGSPPKRAEVTPSQMADVPAGLTQLLIGEISFDAQSIVKSNGNQSSSSLLLKSPTSKKTTSIDTDSEEIKINNHVYTVRVTSSPKPNFAEQSDAELLKQLYNFGIKPLKRKQAVKILEYIYNETHPIIDSAVANDSQTKTESDADADADNLSRHSLGEICSGNASLPKESCAKAITTSAPKQYNLQDCYGDILLRFSMELSAELREGEIYIFQTNVTKKTQQPLVPLHVAWFNLVCSNKALHESIVMYEPIDLQEIYLFLKSLGYRYDPKDLKSFFDSRCIIFRYDLTPPDKQANRHTRKPNKKFTSLTQKSANSQRSLHKYLSL